MKAVEGEDSQVIKKTVKININMTRDLNVFNLSPAEGDEAFSAEWKHVCYPCV